MPEMQLDKIIRLLRLAHVCVCVCAYVEEALTNPKCYLVP